MIITMSEKRDKKETFVLVKNVDYYIEQGRWVFTSTYHSKRGYCCGNGCRHCPYEHINVSKTGNS